MNVSNSTALSVPTSTLNSAAPHSQDLRAAFAAILDRLDGIEQRLTGRPRFTITKKKGQVVTADEYLAKAGLPRVTVAVAMLLTGESRITVIAQKLGVHRRTIQVGPEFAAFRRSLNAIRSGSGVAAVYDTDDEM